MTKELHKKRWGNTLQNQTIWREISPDYHGQESQTENET